MSHQTARSKELRAKARKYFRAVKNGLSWGYGRLFGSDEKAEEKNATDDDTTATATATATASAKAIPEDEDANAMILFMSLHKPPMPAHEVRFC